MAKMLSTAPRLPYININTSLPVNVIQIPPVPCCCYLRSQGCIRYSTVSFHLFFLVIYFLFPIHNSINNQQSRVEQLQNRETQLGLPQFSAQKIICRLWLKRYEGLRIETLSMYRQST